MRNLVWDDLHGFSSTPLNDVDVIYFSHTAIDENAVLERLLISHPDINWQLKNQAFMHIGLTLNKTLVLPQTNAQIVTPYR